ncbi:uncharacterized protein N0V89_003973 [Didymosphaeria variabile]|uniref:Uncharacterized protein n=1 Tax=Didymosphaeria variabile TaxID=1932322 RepID=A0A9W8XNL2_9PLEO|nr:uncharacterized protein N0V89_003973 [Didymosphaeria variabile]KAJ4355948.1 hypothetical protein N0V89_003973 [Didymosphaeria variabile]
MLTAVAEPSISLNEAEIYRFKVIEWELSEVTEAGAVRDEFVLSFPPIPNNHNTTHNITLITTYDLFSSSTMAQSSRSSRVPFGRGGYDVTNLSVPGPAPINAGHDPVNKPSPPKGTQPPPPKQEEKQQDPSQGGKSSSNEGAESMPDSPSTLKGD